MKADLGCVLATFDGYALREMRRLWVDEKGQCAIVLVEVEGRTDRPKGQFALVGETFRTHALGAFMILAWHLTREAAIEDAAGRETHRNAAIVRGETPWLGVACVGWAEEIESAAEVIPGLAAAEVGLRGWKVAGAAAHAKGRDFSAPTEPEKEESP